MGREGIETRNAAVVVAVGATAADVNGYGCKESVQDKHDHENTVSSHIAWLPLILTNISSSAVGAQGESSLNFTAYHERKRPSEEEWEKRERRETDLAQKLLTPPSLLLKIPKQRRLLLNV